MRLVDGTYTERVDNVEDIARSLVAGAAPMYPPGDWFKDPKLDKLTPVTITADGHIYGHIADWTQDHMGLPPGTRPPRSRTDYAFFKTGALKTSDGDEIAIGNLTLSGGHAPLQASAGEAVEHYDNTASAVADINVGEDSHGIWIAGGLRPDTDENKIRALRASAPSGDWRPVNGALELVAICQVNTPGFPVARALAASGELQALVAAGASHLYELQIERSSLSSLGSLEKRVNDLEAVVAAGPKKPFEDAPKSDNSSDDKGDDSAAGQNDEGADSNAGEPKDDAPADKKEDTADVSNDGEVDSNKGKTPPRKPKLPLKKKSLTASADPKALTAAGRKISSAAGARRYKKPIGTPLDGSWSKAGDAVDAAKATLSFKKGDKVKVSTSKTGIHGPATVVRSGTNSKGKYHVVKSGPEGSQTIKRIEAGERIEKFDDAKWSNSAQGKAHKAIREARYDNAEAQNNPLKTKEDRDAAAKKIMEAYDKYDAVRAKDQAAKKAGHKPALAPKASPEPDKTKKDPYANTSEYSDELMLSTAMHLPEKSPEWLNVGKELSKRGLKIPPRKGENYKIPSSVDALSPEVSISDIKLDNGFYHIKGTSKGNSSEGSWKVPTSTSKIESGANTKKASSVFVSGKHQTLGSIDHSAKKGHPEHSKVKVSFADGHIPEKGHRVKDADGNVGTVTETYQAFSKIKWDNGGHKTVNNKKLNAAGASSASSPKSNEKSKPSISSPKASEKPRSQSSAKQSSSHQSMVEAFKTIKKADLKKQLKIYQNGLMDKSDPLYSVTTSDAHQAQMRAKIKAMREALQSM